MERPASILCMLLILLAGCQTSVEVVPSDDPVTPSPTTFSGGEYAVESVVDGDTIRVRGPDGGSETIRLLGIDVPEQHGDVNPDEFDGIPDTAAARTCLRQAGQYVATRVVTPGLLGEAVTIQTDPTADRRGGYGRVLAYVKTQNRSWNQWLVAQGYARVYETEFQRIDAFRRAERAARAANRGLWTCADGTPNPTWAIAQSQAGLTLVTVHADAAGQDGTSLTDEYLVLENRGNTTISIAGWSITDGAGNRFVIPHGTELAPGEAVRVVTAPGTDDAETLYWGSLHPIWNNDGDVVRIRDANDRLVIEYTY